MEYTIKGLSGVTAPGVSGAGDGLAPRGGGPRWWCCNNGLVVKLLEELMGRGLEVFEEQLVHLEEQPLSSMGDAVGPHSPPRAPGGGLTSRKPRVRALSSSTRSVLMYSGGSRWLKEQSPWPSFTYRPPLLMAPATRASAAR